MVVLKRKQVRLVLLEFCVIIKMETEVELDGRLEEKASDDEKKSAGSGILKTSRRNRRRTEKLIEELKKQ